MGGEQRCEELATRQHGLVALTQALDLGMARRRILLRLQSGRWRSILPRIYALAGVPSTWMQRVAAASLWVTGRGVGSHDTAAALWDLEGFEQADVHVSVTHSARAPVPWLFVHSGRLLERVDVRLRQGVQVTSVARTLIDVSATLPDEQLEAVLDQSLVRRQTGAQELLRRLGDLAVRGRPGVSRLRALTLERTGDSVGDSELEAELSRLMRAAGLPRCSPQHEVRDPAGVLVARVDFAYPAARIAIQGESYRWHGGRSRFVKDLRQRNRLQELGWSVLHVTTEDLRQKPDDLIRRLGTWLDDELRALQAIGRAGTHRESPRQSV